MRTNKGGRPPKTDRNLAIKRMRDKGMTYEEIGFILGISRQYAHTVDKRVREKLSTE